MDGIDCHFNFCTSYIGFEVWSSIGENHNREPTQLAVYIGVNSFCYSLTDIFDDINCRIMVAEDGSGNREEFFSMDVCVYMDVYYYEFYNSCLLWPKTVPAGTIYW